MNQYLLKQKIKEREAEARALNVGMCPKCGKNTSTDEYGDIVCHHCKIDYFWYNEIKR